MSDDNDKGVVIYTKDAFYNSTEPFEYLYQFINDPFTLERELAKMSAEARKQKVYGLRDLFKKYCISLSRAKSEGYHEKNTNFEEQPIELNSGRWDADEFGIRTTGPFGNEIYACVHPILPVRRLVNIDTGIEKLELAYKKGKAWRKTICDKRQLASASSIVGLADNGIAVTSENAKYLVTYIHDLENLNYDSIPEVNAVSRLGWMGEEGFSPYVEDLVFDGHASFKHYFESVREHGKYDEWLSVAREARKERGVARLVMAASFASVLVEPCNALPFFVHLWGGSGAGKTVGIMLATSVWANPEKGKYWHTFNSTSVGQEVSAGFVNSLPLILDELQIAKDRKDFDKMIYELSEGVGRLRGKVDGGLRQTATWSNSILTTGEQPISNPASGAGAVNRTIEINCEEIKLFKDPMGTIAALSRNYGFAGRKFIEKLQEKDGLETARILQKGIYKDIVKGDTTEKQALAASLILAADTLTSLWIFEDGEEMNYSDITPFLSTKAEVSANERAYRWLNEWIAQNKNKFSESSLVPDTWGKFEPGSVCILRTVFDKACQESGYGSASFLSWLKRNDHLITDLKGNTKRMRINGVPCQCVVLRIEPEEFDGIQEYLT